MMNSVVVVTVSHDCVPSEFEVSLLLLALNGGADINVCNSVISVSVD